MSRRVCKKSKNTAKSRLILCGMRCCVSNIRTREYIDLSAKLWINKDSLLKKYAQDISAKRMKHREQKHDDCGCD